MGIYLRAEPGAYAERVLVAGDPGRISRLASLLEGPTLVTDNRGLLGYTGRYRGEAVSLQCTGMGCPSMAMVGAELLEYGARTIVRIGTCSSFARGVRNGDLVVVTGSAAADGTTRSMAEGMPFVAVPDFRLTSALVEAAQKRGLPTHVGPVVTVDVEPHLTTLSTQGWRERGLLAVEMEAAALFYLALRATARGPRRVEAACVLTVSDGLEGHPDGPQRYLSDTELEAATDEMHLVALDVVTAPTVAVTS
ncbi:MAG: purine-nucleoside phosphorylase [Chloroflexi bacterium]|nr:purine-nucleoside phosphorylase [Chloroflexota bacterium]